MKANSIQDALNLFDPHRPLVEEDDIKAYYVARDNSPLEEMKTVLKTATDFPKLLFSGPPGCGKRTELANLKEALKKNFHIIMFSTKDISNTLDINLEALLFHILKKIAEKAKEAKLSIYEEKVEKFISHGPSLEPSIEPIKSEKNDKEIKLPLDSSMIEQLKSEEFDYGSALRYFYQRYPRLSLDGIINLINDTVWDLEEKTKKDVLVVVTDMNKLSLMSVRILLTRYVLYLTKINCFAIYTFPLELKYSKDFINIYRNFNGIYQLSNFTVVDQFGAPEENGQKKLREIITKRMHEKLIYDEAVDLIVQLSGGIIFELINLVRQSCIVALMEKIDFIDDEVVREAEKRIRRVYRFNYTNEDRKLLLQVRQNKEFINTDVGIKLFRQLSFTEYGTGDNFWYDVNPILFPLLEEIDVDEE